VIFCSARWFRNSGILIWPVILRASVSFDARCGLLVGDFRILRNGPTLPMRDRQ
jgi:hypothetical protein